MVVLEPSATHEHVLPSHPLSGRPIDPTFQEPEGRYGVIRSYDGNGALLVEVYGYDCRVSYAYPGGLSLSEINDPPD